MQNQSTEPTNPTDCVKEVMRRYDTGEYELMVPMMFPTDLVRLHPTLTDAANETALNWKPDAAVLLMRAGMQMKRAEHAGKTSVDATRWHLEKMAQEFFAEEMRKRNIPESWRNAIVGQLKVNVNENAVKAK